MLCFSLLVFCFDKLGAANDIILSSLRSILLRHWLNLSNFVLWTCHTSLRKCFYGGLSVLDSTKVQLRQRFSILTLHIWSLNRIHILLWLLPRNLLRKGHLRMIYKHMLRKLIARFLFYFLSLRNLRGLIISNCHCTLILLCHHHSLSRVRPWNHNVGSHLLLQVNCLSAWVLNCLQCLLTVWLW